MVRNILAAATVLAFSVTGISAGTARAQEITADRLPLEGVAAIVNDSVISFSDVRQRARLLLMSLGGQQPTQEQIQQITGQALEQLIDERLQLDKAAEYELVIDSDEIDAAINDMASQSGADSQTLRTELIRAGVNPASLEEQMRAEIAWQRVMSGLFGTRIRVSDSQVDDQIDRLRSALKKTQYRVSEIFLFAPDAESKEQANQAAVSIAEQLRAGADFRIAAQRLSSAPTAATGGDMGWISVDDLAPELAAAVEAAPGPGLLDPIAVDDGIYLIFVASKREPATATTKVDLIRLLSPGPSDEPLLKAMDRIKSCDDVQTVANTTQDVRAQPLEDIDIDELGPEGKSLVEAAEIGQPTPIFAAGKSLATMYVCRREEGAEAIPSREDLKQSLKGQELSMISERELRNLRREATILYR
ncbi:MAG: SurA N-terminal domain-containing protein [Hyphomonas sp.]